MNEKIIVIKPDDTIALADYTGYETLRDTVNGAIENFHSTALPVSPVLVPNTDHLDITLFCNDAFLISDSREFDKVNAVASILSGKEIRGNVAVVVDVGGGETRGFEYKEISVDGDIEEDFCECWAAEDTIMRYINDNRDKLREVHKEFDNNKSEPYLIVNGVKCGGKDAKGDRE